MQVSLQALKAFESAARRSSFKLAAEELSLTPTAISHHISKLESRLNVDLFHRQGRRIVLTDTGRQLAAATSEGFRCIENALDEVVKSGRTVRISTTSSLAAMVLIPSLQEFSQAYPAIDVEILTGESVDSQAYILPIRLGDARQVNPDELIKTESFNLFGTPGTAALFTDSAPVTVYTTAWKNKSLPAPPLPEWLSSHGLDNSRYILKCYDQEIFGIQQALAGNGLVFCSTTLVQSLLKTQQLQTLERAPIKSDLCYYIPNKQNFDTRATSSLVRWLEALLNQ